MNTKDFQTLVADQAAAIQGAAAKLVDLTVGSVLRAVIEANALVILWLQGLILDLLVKMRANTASGADLDSWMADFGLTRLGATHAAGAVTFTRFSTSGSVTIPIGTTVQSSDGTQQYTTNAAAAMAGGVATVNVGVKAVTAGSAGNAAIGQVTVITGSVPGVDTVTNAAAFVGGTDSESDSAFRARFRNWLAGLGKATRSAIGAAVASVRAGLSYTITENYDYGGAYRAGSFFVVVDDGTGAPSATLLTNVQAAVDASRALSVGIAVFGPVVVYADVSMVIMVADGYGAATTRADVSLAVTDYINSLTLGTTLAYTRLAQVAYSASPGVQTVTALTLNSGVVDMVASAKQVIKAGTVTVS